MPHDGNIEWTPVHATKDNCSTASNNEQLAARHATPACLVSPVQSIAAQVCMLATQATDMYGDVPLSELPCAMPGAVCGSTAVVLSFAMKELSWRLGLVALN